MTPFGNLRKGINSFYTSITSKEFTEESLKEPLDSLKFSLIENNVGLTVVDLIIEDVQKYLLSNNARHGRFGNKLQIVKNAMEQSLKSVLRKSKPKSFNLLSEIQKKNQMDDEPYIIAVFGINGTGKTTTIMKLGNFLKQSDLSVVFGAGDTFRAGAITQLAEHGNSIGIRTISQQQGSDPTSVLVDTINHGIANRINVMIADTAGRMQNNSNLMRELDKIVRNIEPDLKIFVGDCNAGNDLINQLSEFDKVLNIDGIIMTKFDSDENGGAILSASYVTGKPILFVADGQGRDNLKEYDPKMILDMLI